MVRHLRLTKKNNIEPSIAFILLTGTPFEVTVIDSTSVSLSGDGVRLAKVYKEAGLSLDHQGLDERDLDVKIIGKIF